MSKNDTPEKGPKLLRDLLTIRPPQEEKVPAVTIKPPRTKNEWLVSDRPWKDIAVIYRRFPNPTSAVKWIVKNQRKLPFLYDENKQPDPDGQITLVRDNGRGGSTSMLWASFTREDLSDLYRFAREELHMTDEEIGIE